MSHDPVILLQPDKKCYGPFKEKSTHCNCNTRKWWHYWEWVHTYELWYVHLLVVVHYKPGTMKSHYRIIQCDSILQGRGISLFKWTIYSILTRAYRYSFLYWEYNWAHMELHHIILPQCASVDSANNLKHTLRTCSCTVRPWSDGCWSIKVSIVLCMLSVDTFFVVSIATVVYRRICLCN